MLPPPVALYPVRSQAELSEEGAELGEKGEEPARKEAELVGKGEEPPRKKAELVGKGVELAGEGTTRFSALELRMQASRSISGLVRFLLGLWPAKKMDPKPNVKGQ